MLSTRNMTFKHGVKKLHPKFIGPFIITEMIGNSNNAALYQVEQILSMRIKRVGKRKVQEFLIKWLGYDDSHNSWEPRKNLTEDLLVNYPKP